MSGTKSDIWMPIYIGDLLGDTQHLTNEQFGIYHKIFYHQWRHGHFSGDDLWAIAGFSGRTFGSASSTFQAELKQAFSTVLAPIEQLLSKDEAGLLYSRRCDLEKVKWTHKKKVFAERARKGGIAKARRTREEQAKQEAEKAASSSASRVLEGVLESCTSPSQEEQKQIQPPPTPSAARRGTDAPSTADRGYAPSIDSRPGSSPASSGTPAAYPKSAEKAKPPQSAPGTRQSSANGASAHHGPTIARAVAKRTIVGASRNGLGPRKVDLRRSAFQKEVCEFWKGQNPKLPKYHFKPADERALDDLLERDPQMTLGMLQACLRNRARSEVSPAAAPHKWLRGIGEYAAGALDRYQKPLKMARSL